MQRSGSFFQRFFRTETVGGLILLVFAIVALILANSTVAPLYRAFWETRVSIGPGARALTLTLHQWINDGLMAIFFLLVGLEIKRELLAGELASVKQAALPIAAALGGMVVPAAFYWSFNPSGPSAAGWGIPMATDIAFALGALALIAPRAPIGIKVFLAALAIVDDMGAVLVIATFYSGEIAWAALAAGGGMIGVLVILNLTGVTKLWPYLLSGIVLWYFVHESGVHATIAGVALAVTIPSRTRLNAVEFSREARALLDQFDRSETGDLLVLTSKGQQESLFALERASKAVTAPILRLEHGLHSFSAFVVMPLFAFANAGVQIGGPMVHPEIALGVMAGLVIGKPLGILGASLLAVKSGLARLPDEVNWGSLLGAACLAGIGFTMSLFIAMLAFDVAALINTAKVAILGASLLAGLIAMVVFNTIGRVGGRRRE
ncbi:MAG TPA: Na+/H+ antiporter NhaA [Chthoniobacterales bacterium]